MYILKKEVIAVVIFCSSQMVWIFFLTMKSTIIEFSLRYDELVYSDEKI